MTNEKKNLNKNPNAAAIQSPANIQDENSILERSKYVYELVNSWIENADNKVGVSCGIYTGVFGVITFLSERTDGEVISSARWHCVYRASFILSLVLLGLSILAYVLAINPDLGSGGKQDDNKKEIKKYPIYFGDIADVKNSDEYKKKMLDASEDDFLDELLEETHYNAIICKQKMCSYKWGLWFSFGAVVLAMLSWGARFLMYR